MHRAGILLLCPFISKLIPMNAKFYLFSWLALSCFPSFAQRDFITVWDLSKPGSGEGQISFGASMRGVVNYSWKELSPGKATGSGTLSAEWITLFGMPAGAVIELSLSPQNLTMFYGDKDQQLLIEVKQWGDVPWSSMQVSFANCINLHISATDVPDLSRVKKWRLCSCAAPI